MLFIKICSDHKSRIPLKETNTDKLDNYIESVFRSLIFQLNDVFKTFLLCILHKCTCLACLVNAQGNEHIVQNIKSHW